VTKQDEQDQTRREPVTVMSSWFAHLSFCSSPPLAWCQFGNLVDINEQTMRFSTLLTVLLASVSGATATQQGVLYLLLRYTCFERAGGDPQARRTLYLCRIATISNSFSNYNSSRRRRRTLLSHKFCSDSGRAALCSLRVSTLSLASE
jgi:hypothetical protein